MICDTDVAYIPLLLCLQCTGIGTVGIVLIRQRSRVVELDQIDIIRTQTPQTLFNMRAVGKQFSVAWVNLFNVRTVYDFLKKFGTAVLVTLLLNV